MLYDDVANVAVIVDEVKYAIVKLKKGKDSAPDDISVEHIVHASYRLVTILCTYFSTFLVHGVLPNSLMQVNIVPIIKNEAEPISVMSNDRPIPFQPCSVKSLKSCC